MSSDACMCKRVFDILAVIIFLSIFWPLIVLIYLAVLIMDGKPVLFLQERLGYRGSVFRIFKFRTMIVNAVKQGKGIFVEENDRRITATGRVLRKTSLDELPQLFNVLKGDMSIVGPRPPLPHYPMQYSEYPQSVRQRFTMRPGLTGYAQISGRKGLNWDERFPIDIIYVNAYSFWMDIYILLKTVYAVIRREGVYGDD